ncbi:MAG: hypothetical protein AB3N28_00585 [Kordiimonas sp.]
MKKLLIAFVLLIVAGAGFVFFQLGPIVETGIKTAGPSTLHVDVNVGNIEISPLSGKVSVSELSLGQPNGFGEGPLVEVGEFKMKLEPQSLMSNHVIVDTIEIVSPLFDVRRLNGKTNFEALQEGIDIPATTGAPAAAGEEVTLTIRSLAVKAPRIKAKTDDFLNLDEDIQLADFTLTNLGTDEKGLAPSEVARHVMDTLQPQIAKALITAGASKKIQELAGDAKGTLEKGLGGLLNKLKDKKKDN